MKTSRRVLLWALLTLSLATFFGKTPATHAEDETFKGVVQVIWYENLYGTTPRMIGWGSASMIDHNGNLLTNNHVVDNWFGGTLDGFVVCVSNNPGERPDCHYTASLVARDVEKDIALLRLDGTDIFWNSVNESNFETLTLDYDYAPVSQEQVAAIGYPWVGADTITQTVGVVAGTQEYNGATYIKTDALIAGGNSGGPLTKDGKVIGVNTFGLGYEGTIGFSLLISEAQQFIEENIDAPSNQGFDLEEFHDYLEDIENINSTQSLNDWLFSLDLSDGYRVTEYEPSKLVVSYQMLPDQTNIQAFMLQRFHTPTLATPEEFKFYLQMYGLYSPDREQMKEVEIGGIIMYDIFSDNDPSEWLSYGYKKYVAQLNDNEILFMTIQTPTYNESLFAKAKEKLDKFLTTLHFSPDNSNSLHMGSLELHEPDVSLTTFGDEYDTPLNRWGRGIGSMRNMRYSAGVLRNYLGPLHEYITLNVYPQTRDLGRGVSIEELMKTRIQNIRTDEKWLITIQGNEWFYYCQKSANWMQTAQGNTVEEDICDALIVVQWNEELPYIVEVMMQTEKKNAEKNKAEFFDYLSVGMSLPGWGETIINKSMESDAIFNDLQDQHPDFLNVINELVKAKVIIANRESFQGDMPMTWGDVVKVYLKWVIAVNMDEAAETCGYPVKYDCLFKEQMITAGGELIPVSKMIEDLHIDTNAYAAAELLRRFDLIARLYLAGVKTVPFTQRDLDTFEWYGDQLYPTEKQQLQDREFATFGKRRVPLDEAMPTGYWRTPVSVYRHPSKWIFSEQGTIKELIVFQKQFPRYSNFISDLIYRLCGNNVLCQNKESLKWYQVVTLGDLVNYVFPLMDRSKFIPELEEKKDNSGYGYRG